MRIEQFQYHDKSLEWQLERISFSDLTLLVGISGVGKTQILHSLLRVQRISEGKSLNGIKWNIVFSTIEGYRYRWCGEFETKEHLVPDVFESFDEQEKTQSDKPEIVSEFLYRNDEVIVTRNQQEIILNGKKTPKLSPTSSIISLLSQEDSIRPANQAFHRILHSDQSSSRQMNIFEFSNFDKYCNKYNTLEKIQESELDTQIKLALVYRLHPVVFENIRTRFLEIFPQVTDIKVEPIDDENAPFFISESPFIQIKEVGVSRWIDQFKMSSGMLRTIFHLAEMYLWPEGTVILIDEFENSLGVNCIDVLTEDLLQQHRKLQFILTSHHPYIINNIGPKYWKIVQRKGGVVSTQDASSLGLGESSHEAFIQLINSDAYREGIEAR